MPLFFWTAVSMACRSNRGQADLLCLTRWDGLLVFVLPHNSFITGLFCLGKISQSLTTALSCIESQGSCIKDEIKAPLKAGYVLLDSAKRGLCYAGSSQTQGKIEGKLREHTLGCQSQGCLGSPFPLWVVRSS